MSTTPFAVALIAGGRSVRMGTDKGRLMDARGVEWWRSRLAVLRELGAEETLISCRPDQKHFIGSGARLIFDQWPDAGPLGGVVSCLEAMTAGRLVVLGVDLPAMTGEMLRSLMTVSGPDQGAVFHNGRFFEPLAAVYPKDMAESGRRLLKTGNLALQPWLKEGAEAGLLKVVDPPAESQDCFRNLNSPADLAGSSPVPATPGITEREIN
ncbi:MAG: Molybdopterin-guanine dinucleotide biosynthesis protein A-like protein [Verrucomicrobiales bacterium]|nr:Molybdopterin-guanine dinucleotide biosynthesis protein A-like protein [Verrucomicrobiales bacterium]